MNATHMVYPTPLQQKTTIPNARHALKTRVLTARASFGRGAQELHIICLVGASVDEHHKDLPSTIAYRLFASGRDTHRRKRGDTRNTQRYRLDPILGLKPAKVSLGHVQRD